MKIVDISTEIFIDQGEPDNTSISAIASYIRGQVGKINVLLYEDFYVEEVSGQYEILDADGVEISPDAVAIIKQIYQVYDYQIQIRTQMNALVTDSVLEFTEIDGSSFRRTNRNEISKTLASIRKDEMKTLETLVNSYRVKLGSPVQVAGDDTQEGFYSSFRTLFGRPSVLS